MENLKPRGGRPSTARAAEIGRAIINATVLAYARHGSEFNVDDVARSAGVSKQAIYRRWPTKLALLFDAIETGISNAVTEAQIDLPAEPLPALKALARRSFMEDYVLRMRLTLRIVEHAAAEPGLAERISGWDRISFEPLLQAMIRFQADQGYPEEDAQAKARMLDDMFSGSGFRAKAKEAAGEVDLIAEFEASWRLFLPFLFGDVNQRPIEPQYTAE